MKLETGTCNSRKSFKNHETSSSSQAKHKIKSITSTMRATLVSFLVLLHAAKCCIAFGFAPTFKTTRSPALSASSLLQLRSSPDLLPEQNDDILVTEAITSRRSVLSRSLSSLAVGSCLPALKANADESSATDQPFTVLFTIQLDSTKPEELSELEIECHPDWAPGAAARFKELVELGFYKDSPFFRVLPGFIAQFGISADPSFNKQWMYCDTSDKEAVKLCKQPLPDEPRKVPNKKGTLSFASSGKNSRRTQVFINLVDNSGLPNFLDGQGFVPFARIVRGEDIVTKLNAEYKGNVSQGKAAYYGKEYFEKVFPRLSVIRDAKIGTLRSY